MWFFLPQCRRLIAAGRTAKKDPTNVQCKPEEKVAVGQDAQTENKCCGLISSSLGYLDPRAQSLRADGKIIAACLTPVVKHKGGNVVRV